MLDQLTAEDFRACLHGHFQLTAPGVDASWELSLAEVSDIGDGSGPRAQPFSLIFRAPAGVYLPQQIYRLQNEDMGAMELFLVPLQPDAEGGRLQAIFN